MDNMNENAHESFARLQSFTGLTQAEIGARLGASVQTITNWKSRGISKDGRLQCQEVFGANANWLETGQGQQSVGAATAKPDELAVMASGYAMLLKQFPAELRRDWHSHIVEETLKRLVLSAPQHPQSTNPADR